jgi:hypothetical protein
MNKLLQNALNGMSPAHLSRAATRRNAADNPTENEQREYDELMNQNNSGRRKKPMSNQRRHNRRASDMSENGRHGRRIDDLINQDDD